VVIPVIIIIGLIFVTIIVLLFVRYFRRNNKQLAQSRIEWQKQREMRARGIDPNQVVVQTVPAAPLVVVQQSDYDKANRRSWDRHEAYRAEYRDGRKKKSSRHSHGHGHGHSHRSSRSNNSAPADGSRARSDSESESRSRSRSRSPSPRPDVPAKPSLVPEKDASSDSEASEGRPINKPAAPTNAPPHHSDDSSSDSDAPAKKSAPAAKQSDSESEKQKKPEPRDNSSDSSYSSDSDAPPNKNRGGRVGSV